MVAEKKGVRVRYSNFYRYRWGLLSLALLLVGVWVVRAVSLKQLSGDPGKFLSEYKVLLSGGSKFSKEDKRRFEALEKAWALPNVTAEERQEVIALTDASLRYSRLSKSYLWLWHDVLVHYLGQDSLSADWAKFKELLGAGLAKERSNTREQVEYLQHLVAFFDHGQLGAMLAFEWKSSVWRDYRLVTKPELCYEFNGIDLTCKSSRDSLVIFGTKGRYFPFRKAWEGHGGKVGWLRSGETLESAHAELRDYSIDMRRDQYSADSVTLRYGKYFSEPVEGKLFDRLVTNQDSLTMSVPEFTSYLQTHRLNKIMEGVDFEGGCMVQGSRLIGMGSPLNPVRFNLTRDSVPFLSVTTQRMAFNPYAIVADDAEVTVHLGKDSIYHSGLRFEYSHRDKSWAIRSTKVKLTQSPLYSSFHGLSIYFDELSWREGDSVLTIGPRMGTQGATAFFRSSNYFDKEEFDAWMGMNDFHPILELARYSQSLGGETYFSLGGFSQFIHKPAQPLGQLMMSLAVEGVLLYEADTQMIQLLPRLFSQVKARGGKEDYDMIRFSSTTQGREPNATVNLNSYALEVNKVSPIQVSKTSNVQLRPKGNFVRLENNRNISFDGSVDVGFFHFTGDSMVFNYEDFTIDMKSVSTLDMEFQSDAQDFTGQRKREKVMSSIHNLTGRVLIDAPENKSGSKLNSEYPYFESTQPSRVFYDSPDIQGGAYKADTFYFEVEPFVFKNMSNYEAKDLVFGGTMYPGGVVEPFTDSLRLRPDRSLGFVHAMPEQGQPIYGGKGMFYANLDLSNSGLRGAGKLTYLNSTTHSEQFNFFSDSMTAVSSQFAVAAQGGSVEYPPVEGLQYRIHWYPKVDEFNASTLEEPFILYNKEVDFRGTLSVQPKGMRGHGQVDMRKALVSSNDFSFKQHSWSADTLSLRLQDPLNKELVAYDSKELSGSVDYTSRRGSFRGVSGQAIHGELPVLGYASYVDRLDWTIDGDTLSMSTEGVQRALSDGKFRVSRMRDSNLLAGSVFYSTVPQEDSLYFMSERALYFLKDPHLYADSVVQIEMADAVVHLPKHIAEVKADERLLPFDSVTIDIGSPLVNHHIYQAVVRVEGGNAYGAKGFLDYRSANDSVTQVRFDTIRVQRDSLGHCYSHGEATIARADSLLLDSHFAFAGTMLLDGFTPHFAFDGGVKPLIECDIPTGFARFSARLQRDSIMIPLSLPAKSLDGPDVLAGPVMAHDSIHIYSNLLGAKRSFADASFSQPRGFMSYEGRTGFYVVQDSALYANPDTVARRIAFDPALCRTIADGPLTLPFKFGRPKVQATGRMTHSLKESTVLLRVFMDVDFFCSPDALAFVSKSLQSKGSLNPMDMTQGVFLQGLKWRSKHEDYMKVKSQLELFGELKDPLTMLKSTFSFGDMTMRWDATTRSLVSIGQIGVSSVNGESVNRKVNGFVELNRSYKGDALTIYLEPEPGEFYLFIHSGITMHVLSSDQAMLKIINDLKSKKRRLKAEGAEPEYEYAVGTTQQIEEAQRRYKEIMSYSF